MKYFYHLFSVLLFLSITAKAQFYRFEEVPGWVKPVDIPANSTISKDDIIGGYYFTLIDAQSNLEKEAVFNHQVINVISYSGITNASQLSVTYDTSYQQLIIHHLFIWRKGEKIDRTKDLSIEILNKEDNLQNGIYTGQITAYDILNDIRKDDLIDFTYTVVGDNPIFEHEKYLFVPLASLNPVDQYFIRIIYPADKDYSFKCTDCDSTVLTSKVTGNYKEIEINRKDVKPIKLEDNIPSWTIPYNYLVLSSFHSWSKVNDWAVKVFALDKEPVLDNVYKEIFTGDETMDDKINKIIDYVQDEIRYMGIESGIGSIKPFPPEKVVEQRFGDCKDKSLLLVSLLKKTGIKDAWCALVNTELKYEIDSLFPSNEIFNHCIVRFDYHDTTYWVDPTISQQGGDFRNLFNRSYGRALVIGMPADTLQLMVPLPVKNGADITEEYTMKSFTEPATLTITSDRYGGEADERRSVLEYFSTEDISDRVMEDIKALYPKVSRTRDIVISDDMVNNHLIITYYYDLDDLWADGDKGTNRALYGLRTFRFEPLSLYTYIKSSTCKERKFDYELNYPLIFNYRVIFHFPDDLLMDDDIDIYDNEVFYLSEKYKQISSNSLQIDYEFRSKTDHVSAAKYLDICEAVNSIATKLQMMIYFKK
jgi:hypothetical protein